MYYILGFEIHTTNYLEIKSFEIQDTFRYQNHYLSPPFTQSYKYLETTCLAHYISTNLFTIYKK